MFCYDTTGADHGGRGRKLMPAGDKRAAEEDTKQAAAPEAKRHRSGDMSDGDGGTGDPPGARLRFPNTLPAPMPSRGRACTQCTRTHLMPSSGERAACPPPTPAAEGTRP